MSYKAASQGLASSRPSNSAHIWEGHLSAWPAGLPGGLGGGQSLAPGVLVHEGGLQPKSLQATGGGSFTPSSHLLASGTPLLDTIQSKLLVRHSELFVVWQPH